MVFQRLSSPLRILELTLAVAAATLSALLIGQPTTCAPVVCGDGVCVYGTETADSCHVDCLTPQLNTTYVGQYTSNYSTENRFVLTDEGTRSSTIGLGKDLDMPFLIDWDGDKADTVGVFRPSENKFYFLLENVSDASMFTFAISSSQIPAGFTPKSVVAGDWDGDGFGNVGLFVTNAKKNGKFVLFPEKVMYGNSVSTPAVVAINGVVETDLPVAGDWNGDGVTSVGVYRPSEGKFYLRNDNSSGNAQVTFTAGFSASLDASPSNYTPLAGDWAGIDGMWKGGAPKRGEYLGLYMPVTGRVLLYNSWENGALPFHRKPLVTPVAGHPYIGIAGRYKFGYSGAKGANLCQSQSTQYPTCYDLLIDSNPQGANVYLDGRLQSGVTPLRIPNIVSMKHSVLLSLPYYLRILQEADIPVPVYVGSTPYKLPKVNLVKDDEFVCRFGAENTSSLDLGSYLNDISSRDVDSCLAIMTYCQSDPRVAQVMEEIRNAGGTIPSVECASGYCYNGNASGTYLCGSNTISLCQTNPNCDTYLHELYHARDHFANPSGDSCDLPDGDNSDQCAAHACTEVGAYATQGAACDGYHKFNRNSLVSNVRASLRISGACGQTEEGISSGISQALNNPSCIASDPDIAYCDKCLPQFPESAECPKCPPPGTYVPGQKRCTNCASLPQGDECDPGYCQCQNGKTCNYNSAIHHYQCVSCGNDAPRCTTLNPNGALCNNKTGGCVDCPFCESGSCAINGETGEAYCRTCPAGTIPDGFGNCSPGSCPEEGKPCGAGCCPADLTCSSAVYPLHPICERKEVDPDQECTSVLKTPPPPDMYYTDCGVEGSCPGGCAGHDACFCYEGSWCKFLDWEFTPPGCDQPNGSS